MRVFLDGPFLSDLLLALLFRSFSLYFFFSLSRLFLFGQNDIRDGRRRSTRENEDKEEYCTSFYWNAEDALYQVLLHFDFFLRNSRSTLMRSPFFSYSLIIFFFFFLSFLSSFFLSSSKERYSFFSFVTRSMQMYFI